MTEQAARSHLKCIADLRAHALLHAFHTELVCKAKFSKKADAHVGLHLIKETEGSQYIVAAWNFQAHL